MILSQLLFYALLQLASRSCASNVAPGSKHGEALQSWAKPARLFVLVDG